MNIYKFCYEKHGDSSQESILLFSTKRYTQEEFQDIIKQAKFELGYLLSFDEVVTKLESFGFYPIVTGYYESFPY